MENKYSVWVGGVEINDHYLNKKEADDLLRVYQDLGYNDVVIDNIDKQLNQ